MADENIAKSCEKPKENGVKLKESCMAGSPVSGKPSVDAVTNGNSGEMSKSIISQKSPPTQPHKSLHAGCAKEASNSNHAAPKSDGKPKIDSKNLHETPARDKKRHDNHGKDRVMIRVVDRVRRVLVRMSHEKKFLLT